MKILMLAIGLMGLCWGTLADPCDPGIYPNCGKRQDGAWAGKGMVWNFVCSFPTSTNLCTGYTSDCGDGPCNALEAWGYIWEVWERVKGGQVVDRQGCVRKVLYRRGTGMCCDGSKTDEPIRGIVDGGAVPKGGGCGCRELPPDTCRQCHDGAPDAPERERAERCGGCHR